MALPGNKKASRFIEKPFSVYRRHLSATIIDGTIPSKHPIQAGHIIMNLKIKKLHPSAKLPERGSTGASGLDLFACIDRGGIVMLGRNPRKIGTGIAIEVPNGYDVQVRPRSGLSSKGIGVTFGTIDSDYRGEILITMYLFGEDTSYEIKHGDKIAQMVITKLAEVSLEEVPELSETKRGSGGHGSTGMR